MKIYNTDCDKDKTQILVYNDLRGNTSVNFLENRFFFGLKFSLNHLEYEAKGFIHEKKNFCLISRFS